jgi:hypothetical protein
MRRRFKQLQSLEERLAEEAKLLREQAKLLPAGAVKEQVLRKARQAETGAHMSAWLRSPGLKSPLIVIGKGDPTRAGKSNPLGSARREKPGPL